VSSGTKEGRHQYDNISFHSIFIHEGCSA